MDDTIKEMLTPVYNLLNEAYGKGTHDKSLTDSEDEQFAVIFDALGSLRNA